MSIPVALHGDVVATPGAVIPPGAAGGSWSAGPINYTDVNYTTVDSIKVIIKAECTFTFTGTAPGGGPFSTTSDVELEPPGATKLTDDGDDLLRLGDTASDAYGNTLTASPSQTKLKTA